MGSTGAFFVCAGLASLVPIMPHGVHRQKAGAMTAEAFAHDLNVQLTYLIAFARRINELDLAASLFGEFRGEQAAGWSTTQTAFEVVGEMRDLASGSDGLSRAHYRHMLCLYTHLAEAGGVYESLMNVMGVVQLKPYNLWPFQKLVRVRKPGRVIGPNANATFRELAKMAEQIGMTRLSAVLEDAFRDDIRNGIAHADYVLAPEGMRLRKRNGGNAYVVSHAEIGDAINRGLFFFELLQLHVEGVAQSFRPAREIIGRFSMNPPMPFTVEMKDNGAFSLSTSSPGARTDAAYDRQVKINDRLGGRVFMAYAHDADVWEPLLTDIRAAGFDVPLVLISADQVAQLEEEVDRDGLWVAENNRGEGLLLATPSGFHRIGAIAAFTALLPSVGPLDIVPGPTGAAVAS